MIGIICHPRLQGTRSRVSDCAAAIDEPAISAADFGDVGVRFNAAAVSEHEAEFVFGMLFEVLFEFREFHRRFRNQEFVAKVLLHSSRGREWRSKSGLPRLQRESVPRGKSKDVPGVR